MANETINKVCAAEQAADTAEQDAQLKAEKIVQDAYKKAEEITETILSAAKKEASEKISNAQKQADSLLLANKSAIEDQVKKLGVNADLKQSDINKAILSIIV